MLAYYSEIEYFRKYTYDCMSCFYGIVEKKYEISLKHTTIYGHM